MNSVIKISTVTSSFNDKRIFGIASKGCGSLWQVATLPLYPIYSGFHDSHSGALIHDIDPFITSEVPVDISFIFLSTSKALSRNIGHTA
jgi:hypothetical protein